MWCGGIKLKDENFEHSKTKEKRSRGGFVLVVMGEKMQGHNMVAVRGNGHPSSKRKYPWLTKGFIWKFGPYIADYLGL
ncbi:hypothetical protein Leryth_003581 [Lithospermum erythrorhizon]|nr:hypothetical protein Leryth_003581 [Lithospermum erythrorhizon]